MRKWILMMVACMAVSVSMAASIVLHFENEKDLKEGIYTLGTLTEEGVVVTAKKALAAPEPLIGIRGEPLKKGELIRLDNKLNMALFGFGDEVVESDLQEAYQTIAQPMMTFLPAEVSTGTLLSVPEAKLAGDEPFLIKINGEAMEGQTLILPVKRKESLFKLEVVRTKEPNVWKVDLVLTSEPDLGFWKKGKQRSLTAIPRNTFKYHYQAMFGRLKPGKSFKLTVETHYIKQESYVWTLNIKTNEDEMTQKFNVRFVDKDEFEQRLKDKE